VATKPKKTASYDLKAADRRRNLLIQIGLTSVVVLFAVALVLYIVMSGDKKPVGGETKSIRVASSKLITKEDKNPKVVLSMYEDFLCPVCGRFEQQFGPTISQLIDSGAIAVDYNMVAILSRPSNQNYSSRAGAAAYCVADEDTSPDKQVFRRFHAALYAQQPSETGTVFPTNTQLIEIARQAGVVGKVPDCINGGRYIALVDGLAAASNVNSTPTIRINGDDYTPTTPDALVAKVKEIVGDVPGLVTAPAAPVPTPPGGPAPGAPAAAPAVPQEPAPTTQPAPGASGPTQAELAPTQPAPVPTAP
jgi:protein-disulfide isomerase